MWFVITLLPLLCVIRTQCQNIGPVVKCAELVGSRSPDLRLLLQTPKPIGNSWEAGILLRDIAKQVDIKSIGFDFDVPVEVITNIDDNIQRLDHQRNYTENATDIDLFSITVKNLADNKMPHLTKLFINDIEECTRIIEIPWEMRALYTMLPPRNYSENHASFLYSGSTDAQSIPSVIGSPGKQRNYANCGTRFKHYTGYITNGYTTNRGDWPWHAALYHINATSVSYNCGGSLITRNAVLTAAHCVYKGDSVLAPDRIIIKLGLYNKFRPDQNSQHFDVFQVIPHEHFSTNTLKNDIAILQLSTEPILNDYVRPVCLWLKDKASIRESVDKEGYVIGWGIDAKQEYVENLAEAKMPVVSHAHCLDRENDVYNKFLSAYTYCAGFGNGTSVCNGDSGGGMFFKDDDGIFRIRGIVSLGVSLENSTCDPYEYVIFTNIGKYLDWIENTIAKKF